MATAIFVEYIKLCLLLFQSKKLINGPQRESVPDVVLAKSMYLFSFIELIQMALIIIYRSVCVDPKLSSGGGKATYAFYHTRARRGACAFVMILELEWSSMHFTIQELDGEPVRFSS